MGETPRASASFRTVTGYADRLPVSNRNTVPAEHFARFASSLWLIPLLRRSTRSDGRGIPRFEHLSPFSFRHNSSNAVLLVSRSPRTNESRNGAESASPFN